MKSAFKHALVVTVTITSVAGALLLSGGATFAQSPLQEGINNVRGQVVVGGEVIGQDPDVGIRLNLLKSYRNYDQ
jgi:hypothetical protein